MNVVDELNLVNYSVCIILVVLVHLESTKVYTGPKIVRVLKRLRNIGLAKGGQRGHGSPKIFRKCSHFVLQVAFFVQNSVIRLKSNILPPQKFLGWPRHW